MYTLISSVYSHAPNQEIPLNFCENKKEKQNIFNKIGKFFYVSFAFQHFFLHHILFIWYRNFCLLTALFFRSFNGNLFFLFRIFIELLNEKKSFFLSVQWHIINDWSAYCWARWNSHKVWRMNETYTSWYKHRVF